MNHLAHKHRKAARGKQMLCLPWNITICLIYWIHRDKHAFVCIARLSNWNLAEHDNKTASTWQHTHAVTFYGLVLLWHGWFLPNCIRLSELKVWFPSFSFFFSCNIVLYFDHTIMGLYRVIGFHMLTLLPKMAAISQMTDSNVFSWMKCVYFILIKISLKCVSIDNKPALVQIMAWQQAIIWTNADPVHQRIYAALV